MESDTDPGLAHWASALFLTGTDTGVGKTWVTAGLMRAFQARGLTTLGMKPVASGCRWVNGRLVNDDALLLQSTGSCSMPYEAVNPYAFEPAVSPHIAADRAGVRVLPERIQDSLNGLRQRADRVLVEGVGGWEVPLSRDWRVSGLAAFLGLPVIVVVGLRLGCINHALLTVSALERSGVECAGWIGSCLDPGFSFLSENIDSLRRALDPPLLGVVPHLSAFDGAVIARRLTDAAAEL